MNYIITGGSGFIGTHLANLILEAEPQARVYNLDIVEPGTPNHQAKKCGKTGATFIKQDVREPIGDLPFTPTPDDVIFNFAAIHRTPGHPDHAYFETNIRGAENITAFAARHGIRKIVFTSSIAPYGASEELKHEETLPMPNTPYGISKLVAEKIHEKWQAVDPDNRLLVILRPGIVFGLCEGGNFTRLYWSIRKRKFFYAGRKDTIKACIYVKDLVRFMLYRLTHGSGCELFNCTYEPAFTIEQICDSIIRTTQLHRTIYLMPVWLLMPAAYVAAALGSPLGICPARVRKIMVSTNICGARMAQTGFRMKYSIDDAIADWLADSGGSGLF